RVNWIADNQRKGISLGARLITVHTSPDFSRQLWDLADSDALNALQGELMAFVSPTAVVKEAQLKRWRYALPEVLHDKRYLHATGLPPLFFAGDAFGEPRVEGAILSGAIAGERLLKKL
ncbi:MAG: NAD/FAD-dependent oxidoreductase, partial [Okeania sp. SIO3B3]|nr:NAD/FAD-dependent oxidoreductase [Okeania sp. SIO3B3]